MIYTMTMNPALDYVVDLPSFKLGKLIELKMNIFFMVVRESMFQ